MEKKSQYNSWTCKQENRKEEEGNNSVFYGLQIRIDHCHFSVSCKVCGRLSFCTVCRCVALCGSPKELSLKECNSEVKRHTGRRGSVKQRVHEDFGAVT